MTPAEAEEISAWGSEMFLNICVTIFNCVLYGVYILAFSLGMWLLREQRAGWAPKALVVLLVIAFFAVTGVSCGNMILPPCSFVEAGLSRSPYAAQSLELVSIILSGWSSNILFLTADIVIAWRACAIWMESKAVKWTLMVLLILDAGFEAMDAIVETRFLVLDFQLPGGVLWDWPVVLQPLLSLTVNIVATVLIAYRAWTHHRSVKIISQNKKTQVEAILLLFIESGAIFGLFQVLDIVFMILALKIRLESTTLAVTESLLLTLFPYSAALNPISLVLLVQQERTSQHISNLGEAPGTILHASPSSTESRLNKLRP